MPLRNHVRFRWRYSPRRALSRSRGAAVLFPQFQLSAWLGGPASSSLPPGGWARRSCRISGRLHRSPARLNSVFLSRTKPCHRCRRICRRRPIPTSCQGGHAARRGASAPALWRAARAPNRVPPSAVRIDRGRRRSRGMRAGRVAARQWPLMAWGRLLQRLRSEEPSRPGDLPDLIAARLSWAGSHFAAADGCASTQPPRCVVRGTRVSAFLPRALRSAWFPCSADGRLPQVVRWLGRWLRYPR